MINVLSSIILCFLIVLFVVCKPQTISETVSEPIISSDYSIDLSTVRSSPSSAITISSDGTLAASVNPDSDTITLVDALLLKVVAEITVGDDPRTVSFTHDSQQLLVANHGSDTISVVDINKKIQIATYSVGSMPYGIVNNGVYAFIAEFGLGKISVLDLSTGKVLNNITVEDFPSALALNPDGNRLFITHFFSGIVTVIDLTTFTIAETISTGINTNLSQFIAITSDGKKAYLPQTRSNVTNQALLFDSTVFPIVNVVDLVERTLSVKERITLDTADEPVNMPFAVALSPDEKILYLANAGSDDISVIDLIINKAIAHIDVGSNPRGIAISPDGSLVFVNNVLDGTLSVIDTSKLSLLEEIILTDLPLNTTLLEGKRIFNSSASPILSTDNWISCATCHFDGMMDKRTWLGFPDGPRNSPALFGVKETLPIHWSGDFDELQDVEITIRNIQFGNGLIEGEIHDSLGPSHAGLSRKLDALAVYMASIEIPLSPYTENQKAIKQGQELFRNLSCDSCHVPPLYTNLQLHDVGTGDPTKEKNAHKRGTKFDTPSLRGIWMTSPYFHDGSADTLEKVLQTGDVHNVSSKMNIEQIKDLIAFLRSLPSDIK